MGGHGGSSHTIGGCRVLCLLGSKVEDRGAGGGRLRVRGVWDAGVNRGEKVIGIRQFEEMESGVSFV